MGRTYSVSFTDVGLSAVQDMIAVFAGAAMAFKIHAFFLGQVTKTSVEILEFTLKHLLATATPGSGGNAATPRKYVTGNPAATVTARINDTVQATSSGGSEVLIADAWNLVNGYPLIFAPDDRPVIGLNEAVSLSLNTVPGGSYHANGSMIIEEIL